MATEIPRPQETQETQKSEFVAKLERLWERSNFVCVGLDTGGWEDTPEEFKKFGRSEGQFRFNKEIIDATHDLVCAYKPNLAFYEGSPQGEGALQKTVDYLHLRYPQIPVIGDNKLADIGNTNLGYSRKVFDRYNFDAVTLHPTLGSVFFNENEEIQLDALEPFLSKKDKGIFVLCRTSNKSAGEFQDLPIALKQIDDTYADRFGADDDELRQVSGDIVPLYQFVAFRVSKYWNMNGNCGVVVGATYPEELAQVRKIVGDMPILIPGIEAQGGDIEATVQAGEDSRNWGMIINASRSVIFASKGPDFAEAARREAQKLHDEINKYRY